MTSQLTLSSDLPLMLPKLWRFALKLARNSQDAEDLVQRTCVRALERESQLRTSASMRSWLYSIMYSVWVNELRSRRVHNRIFTGWDERHDTQTQEWNADPETTAYLNQIVKRVAMLPERQRTVI